MPKILITGNGFDLSYGLPTSYNDFIKILNFIENNNERDFASIYSVTSDYNNLLNQYIPFKLDLEKIGKLENEIMNNLWYQFFKNEFQIETWIDFENKIEYVLNILFTSTKHLKENLFSNGSLAPDKLYYNTNLFNNDIEIIQVLKAFGILSLDERINITFNEHYLINKYDFFIDIDIDKITKKLNEELIDFKRIFNYYFEAFIFPFYDHMKFKIDKTLFSSILKHYTFNYTPTFENFFKKNHTSYLHGKIDSELNKIVLGINEIPESELDKKFFLPFTKYFQKLDNRTDYIFIKEFERKKSLNYMFFFFGHSLDKSDEDYINEVFDFVNDLKSKIKKIVIIYHNEKSKSQLLINLLNIRGKKDIQELMKSEVLIFRKNKSLDLIHELKRDISSTSRTIR